MVVCMISDSAPAKSLKIYLPYEYLFLVIYVVVGANLCVCERGSACLVSDSCLCHNKCFVL